MADVVYFDGGISIPFCPPTVNGIYISGSGCCSEFYSAFIGGNQTYNLTYTLPTASGTSGQVLTNDGNGNLSWTTVSGGGGGGTGTVTGTGTTNYLSKWSSSTALTNSIVLETGSTIDISGALRVTASSGTATAVMGRDANGYVSNLSLGNGLSISGGTLSFTGSTGVSGNFVPYLGATGNTDLGGYGIAGSYFQLSTSTGGTLVPGMFSWNGTDGTADLMLKGGSVTLQIGQEQVARVINETGANLLESQYKVVRVNGSTGTRLKVALALASGDATSVETLGVVTENITLNQEGFVTTSGLVRGINTTGSLQGETWSDGDMLFLSPYVAGGLTNIKPQAPNHLVVMGYVVTAANNGTIYVKVDNGYELDELHNVLISSAATNNILAYDGVTGVWRNRTASSLNIASGSGTATQLAFWGGATGTTSNTLTSSTGLTWDSVNSRLGVNISTPTANLHVRGVGSGTGTTFLIQNSGGTNLLNVTDDGNVVFGTGLTWNNSTKVLSLIGASTSTFAAYNVGGTILTLAAGAHNNARAINITGGGIGIEVTSSLGINNSNPNAAAIYAKAGRSGTNVALGLISDKAFISNVSAFGNYVEGVMLQVRGSGTTTGTTFLTQSSGGTETFRILDNGNVGVNIASPSARLHIRGSGNNSTSTSFLVQNSSSNNMFSVLDNGNIGINTNNPQQTLHIEGTMRLTGSTGDSTTIMGRNASGDVSAISIGSGLSLSGNTLSSTGGGGGSGTVTGSGTATQVAFWGGSTTLNGSSNLYWDNVNGRLGIGTASPSSTLSVNGSATISSSLSVSGGLSMSEGGNIHSYTAPQTNRTLAFVTNSKSFRLFPTGSFSIGTTSDIGRLGVRGAGITTGTTLLLQNSGSTNTFAVLDNGQIGVNTATPNTSSIFQIDSTTLGFLPPRMSTTNKIGIASPAQGLVVYDTTMQALSAYNGSNWATVGGGEQMFTITGSTATIDFNAGNIADITLATSTTLTLTGGTFGTFIIKLTQDATGGRVVSWPSNVRWSGGIPPSLTTTGGKVDVISLIFDGTNYYGTYALNF